MILSEIMGILMKSSSLIMYFDKPTLCHYRLGMKGPLITKLTLSIWCYWKVRRHRRRSDGQMDTFISIQPALSQCQLHNRVAPNAVYIHHDSMPDQRPNKHQAILKPLKTDPKQVIPTPESIISNMFTTLGSWLTQLLFWDRKWIFLVLHLN